MEMERTQMEQTQKNQTQMAQTQKMDLQQRSTNLITAKKVCYMHINLYMWLLPAFTVSLCELCRFGSCQPFSGDKASDIVTGIVSPSLFYEFIALFWCRCAPNTAITLVVQSCFANTWHPQHAFHPPFILQYVNHKYCSENFISNFCQGHLFCAF